MRTRYRNDLKNYVLKRGMVLANFRVVTDDETQFKIEYKDSALVFMFILNPLTNDSFEIKYSCYNNARTMVSKPNVSYQIHDAFSVFDNWLAENVAPYIEDDNLEDPFNPLRGLDKGFAEGNLYEPFSEGEKEEIKSRLKQLPSALVNEFQNEYAGLLESIERLEKALEDISKKIDSNQPKGKIKEMILGSVISHFVEAGFQHLNLNAITGFIYKHFSIWKSLSATIPTMLNM